jgi:integrase
MSAPSARARRPRARDSLASRQLAASCAPREAHRLFAFYHLAAYTGARRGELLNLRWRDIDLEAADRITGSAAVISAHADRGHNQERPVPHRSASDAEPSRCYRDHRSRQTEERLAAGLRWKGTDDYVCPHGLGQPRSPGHRLLAH